jgi:hypothetical protein
MSTPMRAKMRINRIEQFAQSEILHFTAVYAGSYPSDGTDENNTFAKFTPSADIKMQITNPALLGQFKPDEVYYVDFTPVK